MPVPSADIAFGADIGTFFAANAFSVLKAVFFQFDADRAFHLTGLTVPDAVLFISLKRSKRKLRQQCKNSPHRAEILAKKPFFTGHADDDQYQQD